MGSPASGSKLAWAVVATPIGPLGLEASDDALTAVRLDPADAAPTAVEVASSDHPVLAEAAAQLDAYFAGQRASFDLPLASEGTAFQQRVWTVLAEIPYGQTWSYGDVAAHVGAPRASRAVGAACGRNPLAVVVPCHRVVGADGRLTGYGGGLARKQALLDLERAHRLHAVQSS